MTLQEQFEQAKAQLKEINAGRPKVYRAWGDTWTTFHEDPAAFHKAYDSLYSYDIEKNKVLDEVKRLKEVIEENTCTGSKDMESLRDMWRFEIIGNGIRVKRKENT